MTSRDDARLAEAIRAFEDALGAEHVVRAPSELEAGERATFATSHRIPAILRPADRPEVQACVRIANRLGVPLYPVSRGKNWGFGSRVPTRDGAFLLELSRLGRVVEFDEAMGYLTVEPGVTFAAAYRFLRERRSRLFLNSTGSTPESSLVGNALERGDGAGPNGDRFAHVCAFEVVLPTGQCVHTGFGRFEGSRVTPLHRFGVGPDTEGLFAQSGLG